jgi:flagellar hook assembly protein FlgD
VSATVTPEPNYTTTIKVYNSAGEIVRMYNTVGTYDIVDNFEIENQVFSPDNGQSVKIIIEGKVYSWDGYNQLGSPVENGVYYIHVEAMDKSGFVHSVTKDVTVLTNSVKIQIRVYNSAGEIVKTIPAAVSLTKTGANVVKIVPEPPEAFVPNETVQNYVEIHYMGQVIKWDGTNDLGTVVDNGLYTIQVVNIDESGTLTVAKADVTVLHQGFEVVNNVRIIPNPIDVRKNAILTIRYDAIAGTKVKAKIYNVAGELVKVAENGDNTNEIQWNMRDTDKRIVQGLYIVVLEARTGNGLSKTVISKFTIVR